MSDDHVTHWQDYPDIASILDSQARLKCQKLFEELESLTVSSKVLLERIDEIKQELEPYQQVLDAPGIRYGQLVYTCEQIDGRRTLSPTALMEQGVAKDMIDSSYVMGKPYSRRTFRRMKEGGVVGEED